MGVLCNRDLDRGDSQTTQKKLSVTKTTAAAAVRILDGALVSGEPSAASVSVP